MDSDSKAQWSWGRRRASKNCSLFTAGGMEIRLYFQMFTPPSFYCPSLHCPLVSEGECSQWALHLGAGGIFM